MDPRAEAFERLGGRYEVRVLEPSPPAVNEPPWFADDPVAPSGDLPDGRLVVSPVSTGDVRWEELAREDPQLGAWCAERWLGPVPRLGAAPASLVETRVGLHQLAERVISPARQAVNGKIGLRYTRGGFGTPFFGEDVQVRVERGELWVNDRSAPITTLGAAATLVGVPAPAEDARLAIDPEVARFLGDWYGFASWVLEELRWSSGASDASRVQLWPEHFDISVELGAEADGQRAGYGCSPGDERHREPYIYVTPWAEQSPGELWQASGFRGAELAYAALLEAEDQRAVALDFFRTRLAALTG